MIVFEFSDDLGKDRIIYWLGLTDITGDDKEEEDGINEALAAHDAFLDA